MFPNSWVELSRGALRNNLQFIRSRIRPETRISAVVKGNAYGHGDSEMVGLMQQEGIDHFSVYSASEAHEILDLMRPEDTLMIMGAVEDEGLEWAVQNEVEFFVPGCERLRKAAEIAAKCGHQAKVHLELETGMNRTGIELYELEECADILQKEAAHLSAQGVCTHFAGAESIANYHRIQKQIANYRKAVRKLESLGVQPEFQHTSCSAAILRYPRMNLDLVRIGILQYGLWPSHETLISYMSNRRRTTDPLKRVIAWKTRIMDFKEVTIGQFVGYGMGFQAPANLRLAILPVGYSHGYSRSLSNQGHVLIHGKRAPIVGTINMNSITVDVTHIEASQKGDEVVLIGTNGEESISVASFGELSNQLNYELLTRLPERIPRFITD